MGTNCGLRRGNFDVVTAFGVLHHVAEPGRVIAEMLRVAGRAIFIHDVNTFAGEGAKSWIKLALRRAGLWPLAVKIRTRGRGWDNTELDGVLYSYSVLNSMDQLQAAGEVFAMTCPYAGHNLLRSSGGLSLLVVKPQHGPKKHWAPPRFETGQ